MTYKELLLSPNWQKKRLEILNRDNFTCQLCFCTMKTLHVHHLRYKNGLLPWEYENTNFKTLCHLCHKEEEKNKKIFNDLVESLLYKDIPYSELIDSLLDLEAYYTEMTSEINEHNNKSL